ncbi:unnamed protein product [Phaeothamnion confervicola]
MFGGGCGHAGAHVPHPMMRSAGYSVSSSRLLERLLRRNGRSSSESSIDRALLAEMARSPSWPKGYSSLGDSGGRRGQLPPFLCDSPPPPPPPPPSDRLSVGVAAEAALAAGAVGRRLGPVKGPMKPLPHLGPPVGPPAKGAAAPPLRATRIYHRRTEDSDGGGGGGDGGSGSAANGGCSGGAGGSYGGGYGGKVTAARLMLYPVRPPPAPVDMTATAPPDFSPAYDPSLLGRLRLYGVASSGSGSGTTGTGTSSSGGGAAASGEGVSGPPELLRTPDRTGSGGLTYWDPPALEESVGGRRWRVAS